MFAILQFNVDRSPGRLELSYSELHINDKNNKLFFRL